ncbi:RdgB/HAM1 family non-canonical purine NTP pyrophosphatase [Sulfurospirillum diekertiae]|uniref:dITP/XTP pyrophosphatase n=1 Tax=Sulfurospirillum diekertiae TaxID=1854492 RepID=A0A6G9VT18_9BACT|nr:RdgB/HAM1 family non-canonical purine NTP pyrophosphatase [Sulfurospirillum diekertiae]QIR75815.1 RdgB/HAM1 family non-canonical purine NTP pyrophosphatase [Sulfurospirillum diekertiae]QIR78460.1 RdgB/HAM1 family non-canonical purine NTP pyrophosphatase [Sulfurospirillum diekertiae]
MRIILATSNQGKVKEFQSWISDYEVVAYSDIMAPFEIEETGSTFKENALIKARAVYEKLESKNDIVLSDDSGISVPALGGIPGIYSARYAGINANAKENLAKLIATLKENGIEKTPAFYTAAIALVCAKGEFCVHGWMHGEAIADARGNNGFGYDPMFIPCGYKQTLGELDESVKKAFSHRARALELAYIVLKSLK